MSTYGKKFKVNSDCPAATGNVKVHQWTTHEGISPLTGKRVVTTWCKQCNGIPK